MPAGGRGGADVQHRVRRVGVLFEPGPTGALLENCRTGCQPRVPEEPLVAEHLERGPSVRDDGRLDTDVDGTVVDESPQVRIFDPGVRHEENQVCGAVCGDDPLGGGPAADTARVLDNV